MKRPLSMVAAVLLSLGIAACGGEAGSSTTSATATPKNGKINGQLAPCPKPNEVRGPPHDTCQPGP